MGAETWNSSRARTPSRLSNCGEMVAESVLQQLEAELMLHEEETEMEMEMEIEEWQQSSPVGGGARTLLVGMKFNAACREMLAWTIVEVARPGDRIVAFHVAPFPLHSVVTSREYEEHFEHLARTLRGYLAVYEGLCLLKQIKLEVEIVAGVDVKKVLVEFAKAQKTCKLILGSNKLFSVRRNKSLGKYCLKRLPCTCSVVVLQRGEVILNEKGRLSRTDLTSIGAGMIKTLRRGMLSFGRARKHAQDQATTTTTTTSSSFSTSRPSHASHLTITELSHNGHSIAYIDHNFFFTDHSAELEKCYFSDSSLFHSSLFQEFMSSPTPESIQRADMFMLENQTSAEESDTPTLSVEGPGTKGWPLMHQTIGLTPVASPEKKPPSPLHRLPFGKDMMQPLSSFLYRFSPEKEKEGVSEESKITVSSRVSCDRRMSVVDWALQLPHRKETVTEEEEGEEECEEEDYVRILGEIARDAFGSGKSSGSRGEEEGRVAKKVKFSLDEVESLGERLRNISGVERKCVLFLLEELEAATSNFSSCNVVGRGGGSKVYKGMLSDGKLVAVKRLNYGPQAEEELLNDLTINTSISHPHVVTLLGYCVGPEHLILVYDYLPEGNLEDRLHGETKAPVLPWHVRYKAAVGIAKALDYLHHGTSRPIIHRDVKASNILLTVNFESQLSDFGLAKWAPKTASHILCDDILGTFGYLAPEYFMYGRVNNKTDVYAFGVVLLELITGRIPIDNTKPKGHENLVNWARPLLRENALEELVDPRLEGVYSVDQMNRLLHAASLCVRQSSQGRPSMTRVLQIICSTHQGELQPIRMRPEEREDGVSVDLEDCDTNISIETPTFGGSCASSNIQTHLALAMLGVDDTMSNNISKPSSLDHCGVGLLKHPEAYLESRSSYLVK